MNEESILPTMEMSWKEYKEYCFARQFYQDSIFRGQSNSEWQLIPTLNRYGQNITYEEYYDKILPKVKRYISSHVEHDFDLSDSYDRNRFLGLLQHNGFPTPLLDWTYSPYIAAYFAFMDYAFREPSSDHVAIWVLGAEFTIDYLTKKVGKAPFDIVVPDGRFNKRLLAQDGLFTIALSPRPLDEELHGYMEEFKHPGLLQKILLPAFESWLALKDLSLMGIHAGTLFPGIEGTSLMLKNQIFIDSDIAKTPRMKRLIEDRLRALTKDEESPPSDGIDE